MDFHYIANLQDYQDTTSSLVNQTLPIALDTETSVHREFSTIGSALDAHTSEISLLIIKPLNQPTYIFDLVWLRELNYQPNALQLILSNSECLLGANIKFDLKVLYNEFGVWFDKLYDVVIGAQLISNAAGSRVGRQLGHSYADICRELLNIHIAGKKDLRVSSWAVGTEGRNLDNPWWIEKLTYAANDVQYLFPIRDIQVKTLCTPLPHTPLIDSGNHSEEWGYGMSQVLEREMKLVPVTAQMEYNGVPTNKQMMGLFQNAVKAELNRVGAFLSKEFQLDTPMQDWEGNEIPTEKAMRMLRSSQGLVKLINQGLQLSKIDNTQAEGLRRMIDILDTLTQMENPNLAELFVDEEEEELYSEFLELEQQTLSKLTPVVKAILDFKKLTKQDGMDLRKYINPVTNRIHASYAQLGAATGRLSCIAKGQRVMIPGGWKNIEDIKPGDYVYCYSDDGKPSIKKVLNAWCEGIKEVVRVNWQSSANTNTPQIGEVICTPDHKIKTVNRDWVEALELLKGEPVYNLTRSYQLVNVDPLIYGVNAYCDLESTLIKTGWSPKAKSIENKPYSHSIVSVTPIGEALVYNLEIEDYHNFIVNELVHINCSSPNLQQQSGRTKLEIKTTKDQLFN